MYIPESIRDTYMPATPTSTCTCFHLRRAARMVSQVYDRELAAVDLSLNEYSILRHASRGPCLLGELADALGMERTTLTRNLRPLIDAGWIKEARGADARQRVISLTANGRKRITRALPYWQRAQQQIDAVYGDSKTMRLRGDLEQLNLALRGQVVAA